MKLRPVLKFDRRNMAMSKKFDDDIMSANCDVIVIFPIYGQSGAIQKPDSGHMVCKIYTVMNSIYLTKTKNSTKEP